MTTNPYKNIEDRIVAYVAEKNQNIPASSPIQSFEYEGIVKFEVTSLTVYFKSGVVIRMSFDLLCDPTLKCYDKEEECVFEAIDALFDKLL